MPADPENDFQTIHASAADILRWVLLMSISRRISVDRKMDIIRAAERIVALAKQL